MNNIEVEIRGSLTKEKYNQLEAFLKNKGSFVESHDREMILLHGYPGFDMNPLKRLVDIRLRNTNGQCEIMIKRTASENNIGRTELSIQPVDNDWENLKELARSFGVAKGTLIHRKKEIYVYKDIEWSLVSAPGEIFYYEAEFISDTNDIKEKQKTLIQEAQELNLEVFTPEDTKVFIEMLNEKVNKEITL